MSLKHRKASTNFNNNLVLKGKSDQREKPLWLKLLHKFVPITNWLINYHWREDLMNDVIGGLTIAIMQVPQGMAYALLANVPAVLGLYVSVFPVYIYSILGPSHHISMGTNALTCMLASGAVTEYGYVENDNNTETGLDKADMDVRGSSDYTPTEVITAICILVGIWQIGFAIIGFGKLAWIMGEVFMSGYTTATSIHVFTSQLKDIFGLKVPRHSGALKLVYSYIDIFKELPNTNWASFTIGMISIIILVINNELIKPKLAKKCSFPVPIQLIVVILGTGFSALFAFEDIYEVDVVGDIPEGMPQPTVPEVSLFKKVVVDALIIAIVGYCISLSMAKLFGTKFNYSIDGNQEMLGEGVSNVFGSFFLCIPSAASMARSLVQVNVGGKTQLVSIISATLLIFILLFIGPLFEPLPKACLAAIIIVALKGMFLQFWDLPKFWKKSKMDGLYWIGTFVATVLLDIDSGLAVGLIISVFMTYYHGLRYSVAEQGIGSNKDGNDVLGDLESKKQKTSEKAVQETLNFSRIQGLVIIRLSLYMSFTNYEKILKKMGKILRKNSDTLVVVI